jgi:hypothetical protein
MNSNKLLNLLNEGSRDELMTLPGIGPALADGLIAARPFESLEAAQVVNGISANILGQLEQAVAGLESVTDHDTQTEVEARDESSEVESVKAPEVEGQGIREELSGEGEPVSEETPADSGPAPETLAANQATDGDKPVEVKEPIAEKEMGVEEEVSETAQAAARDDQADQKAVVGVPEKPEVVSKSGVSLFVLFATSVFTSLVTILLTLVVLAGINGSLRFSTESEFQGMKSESAQLASQVETLQQDLSGLRSRVDTLEGLGERIVVMEKAQQQFMDDLEMTNQQVSDVQAEVTALNEQVEQQNERTQRFETFLMDLQTLLSGLFAPEGE